MVIHTAPKSLSTLTVCDSKFFTFYHSLKQKQSDLCYHLNFLLMSQSFIRVLRCLQVPMWVFFLSSDTYHQLNSFTTLNNIGMIYFQNFHKYRDLDILIKDIDRQENFGYSFRIKSSYMIYLTTTFDNIGLNICQVLYIS